MKKLNWEEITRLLSLAFHALLFLVVVLVFGMNLLTELRHQADFESTYYYLRSLHDYTLKQETQLLVNEVVLLILIAKYLIRDSYRIWFED